MKLTLKITLFFLLVACGLVGVSGYLSVQREVAFFEEEMTARHGRLVTTVEPMVRDAWRSTGRGGMLQFVAKIEGNKQQVRIRWVWLDNTVDAATEPVAADRELTQLVPGRLESLRIRDSDGTGLFCSYYAVVFNDGRRGALELSESLERRDQYTRDTIQRTVVLMVALVGGAIGLVTVFGLRLIGRPLAALIRKTEQVATGNLRTPVIVSGSDELATLATALNQMGEKLHESQQVIQRETTRRIEAMEQLRHADRLKTVGRLASGMAHELGTPLNVIGGRAGLIRSGKLSAADMNQSAEVIQSEATRMTTLVQHLMNFARRSTPRRTACSLNTILDRTVELLSPIAKKRNAIVSVTAKLPDNVLVNVDAAQMQQVFSNLLTNAMLSKESGVEIQIALESCDAGDPEAAEPWVQPCVCVRVSDNGTGISAEHQAHIFEPFFTTREVGEGTGLGLSIAHGIVAEHGGWMTVESSPEGTTFTVCLPRDSETRDLTNAHIEA